MSRYLAKTCQLATLILCAWVCSSAQVHASCGDHVVWGKSLSTINHDPQMSRPSQLGESSVPVTPQRPCPCRGTSCQQAPAEHAPLPTPTKVVSERDSVMLFGSTQPGEPELSCNSLGLPYLAASQFLAGRLLRPPQPLA